MGLFTSSKTDKAIAEHRAARRELDQVARRDRRRGIRHETPAFLKANQRVIEAEKNLPWWRR